MFSQDKGPVKALPSSRLARFPYYSTSTELFIFCFPAMCSFTAYVREELGCRFTSLSLCLQLICGLWFIVFFFPSILCLWYVAPFLCHWALNFGCLLTISCSVFWLFYCFLCCVRCGLTFSFAWGPTHRSHGFHFCLCFMFLSFFSNVIKLHSSMLALFSCTPNPSVYHTHFNLVLNVSTSSAARSPCHFSGVTVLLWPSCVVRSNISALIEMLRCSWVVQPNEAWPLRT